MKGHTMLTGSKIQYYKDICPKLIYGFKAITGKIPKGFYFFSLTNWFYNFCGDIKHQVYRDISGEQDWWICSTKYHNILKCHIK